MRVVTGLAYNLMIGILSTSVSARLPLPSDEAKAKAVEAAAKSAWNDKVGLYQLCVSQDRVVAAYKRSSKADGKRTTFPASTTPCADPGPYVSTITPATSKPLESSGAHSPPGNAVSPPSMKATAAEIASTLKK